MLKPKIDKARNIMSHVIASCLSYIIPKKKNYWAFVSFEYYGKYSGNNKALFEYLHKNSHLLNGNKQVEYITNNKQTERYIRGLNLPVKYNKFFWLFPLLRAELIFTDGIRRFMGIGRFRYIQLWHGSGFKNIGFGFKGPKDNKLHNFLLQKFSDRSLVISATSEEMKDLMEIAFNSKRVKITGYPRNDIFFSNNGSQNENRKKRILYAPTFRDKGEKFSAMSSNNWDKLQNLMESINADFIIKKHPSDYKLTIPTDKKNIIDVTKETEDIQVLLTSVDVLITDYSSISTDFAISDKPIIFYLYDHENYITKNRTLCFDIKNVAPGPFAYTPEELMSYLEDFDWFNNPTYQKKYREFKNKFHKYCDGNSSERLLKEVLSIVN